MFFMISSYLYSSVEKNGRQGRQIIKILKLVIYSAIAYIVWSAIYTYLYSCQSICFGDFLQHTKAHFQLLFLKMPANWIIYFLFNEPPFAFFLWYLSAFLYVLVIMAVSSRIIDRKKLYFIIPLLLACSLFLCNYSKAIFDWSIPKWMYRNFLFTGLPFFLIGDFLQGYEKRRNISVKVLLALVAISIVAVFAEDIILSKANPETPKELYLGTIPLAAALLILSEKECALFKSKIIETLSGWGKRYSLGIYMSHMMLLDALFILGKHLSFHFSDMPDLTVITTPLCVLAIDLLLLMLWQRVKQLYNGKNPVT